MQCVERREHVVVADLLAPLERATGVVETQPHSRVNVLGRADPLAKCERSLVDELADDPAENEARSVVDPFDVLAAIRKEPLRGVRTGVGRGRGAGQLDQRCGGDRR